MPLETQPPENLLGHLEFNDICLNVNIEHFVKANIIADIRTVLRPFYHIYLPSIETCIPNPASGFTLGRDSKSVERTKKFP